MSDIEQSAALHALLNYGQADEDGVMCVVSRQAVHEVADELAALRSLNEKLVEASQGLITAIVNGTVYENSEPSYHNGPMGALFEAVEDLSEAIACSVYRDDPARAKEDT